MGRKPFDTGYGEYRREWGAHARGGWTILFLWQGSKLSNSDVARLCQITRRGAAKMMDGLSKDFPIVYVNRRWEWMEKEDKKTNAQFP